MLKNLFKLLIVMTILLTSAYANNQTKNSNIQNELTKIKIELAEIKLIQQYENRDKKIADIEKNIKDLESRLNKGDIDKNSIEKDFEKYDEIIKRQDARISDINSNVNADITLYSSIVGVLFILISILSYKVSSRESEETLQEWIKKNADAKFTPILDENLEQANLLLEEIRKEGEALLAKIEKEANKLNQKNNDKLDQLYGELVRFTDGMKEYKRDKSSSLQYEEKIDANNKAYYEQELEKINKALETATSDNEISKLLFNKAIILVSLEQKQEAVDVYNEIVSKFETSKNEDILEAVVSALLNKAGLIGDNEIADYTELINKFSDSKNKIIFKTVTKAYINRAIKFVLLGDNDNALQDYIETINRVDKPYDSEMSKIISSAFIGKIEILLITNKNIDNDLEFVKKIYSEEKGIMIKFSMLEILNNSKKSNQDEEIQKWQKKYKGQNLNNWTFRDLDEWNKSMPDGEVKDRIKNYLDVFKTKLESKNPNSQHPLL